MLQLENSNTGSRNCGNLKRFFFFFADIDECKAFNGHCLHQCHDTKTGYYCSCNTGYELMDDRRSCKGNWAFIFITKYSDCIES